MKITRIGAGYVVLLWMLVVVLIGTVLYLGYRRNASDLSRLMENEADRLINVVNVSAAAGVYALDTVEEITADRLLDNARFLASMSEDTLPAQETLDRIAVENNLHMIHIIGPDGGSLVRSTVTGEPAGGEQHHPEVEAVLSGEKDEATIGFMESRYYLGKRYGVVVARPSGGAVVINADSDTMLDLRRQLGLGVLFRELGGHEGIRYLALQDEAGIIAASPGVTTLVPVESDPFLRSAGERNGDTRILETDDGRVYEIVRSLTVDDVNLGLIRIGLSMSPVEQIRARAARQFLILFIAAVLSGAFVLIFIVIRQNYVVLDAEHDRILQEVRRMEEETRRSERLTSMGRLAAGIAHEIRNPLNAVGIIAQRLHNEFTPTGDEEEYRTLITMIRSEIDRIGGIIRQFLNYARPPELSFKEVRAADLVEEAAALVRENARSSGIAITTEVPHELTLRCDPGQIKQALLNILLNALDAMRSNGSDGGITVSARARHDRIVLRIADTGGGIPDDVLSRIFDPYFTTRDTGTGLGLSEVHRIITAHGGAITAENTGSGAIFEIQLPVYRERG